MKFFISFIIAMVLFTLPCWALDSELKDTAFRYTSEVVTYDGCSECFYPDRDSCLALYERDGVGYWLTSDVPEVGLISVDGHEAQIYKRGVGWVVLVTETYAPFLGMTPHTFYVNDGEEFYYSDINQYQTVTKGHEVHMDAFFVEMNTTPLPENEGAPVFNHMGEVVGIVVGKAEPCKKCPSYKPCGGTRFIRLTLDMFEPVLEMGEVPKIDPVFIEEIYPEVIPEVVPQPDFSYQPDEEPEVIVVEGRG